MAQRYTIWKEEGHVFAFQQMDDWEDGTQYLNACFVDGGSVVSDRITVGWRWLKKGGRLKEDN